MLETVTPISEETVRALLEAMLLLNSALAQLVREIGAGGDDAS